MSYAKRIKKVASKFHEGNEQPVLSVGKKKKKQTENRIHMSTFSVEDVTFNETFEHNGLRFHYELGDDEQVYLVREL